MSITGGFGTTTDLKSGVTRRWVIGRDGVKRWADNGAPCEPNCDRSECGDYSPGDCDHPDCPARQAGGMMDSEDLRISEYPPRCGMQNRVSNGISVEHIPTGTRVIVTRHRSQHQNKADAMRALAAIFEEPYLWPNP